MNILMKLIFVVLLFMGISVLVQDKLLLKELLGIVDCDYWVFGEVNVEGKFEVF